MYIISIEKVEPVILWQVKVLLLNRNNVRIGRFQTVPTTWAELEAADMLNIKTIMKSVKDIYAEDPRWGQAFSDEITRIMCSYEKVEVNIPPTQPFVPGPKTS